MQLPHQGSSQTRRLLRTCGGACAEAEERVVTLGLLLLALCNPRRSGGGRRGLAAAPPARGISWALRGNSCGCTAAGGFEISESLLRWEPMLAGKVDSYGRTALHYAALACGTGPPLKLLLKNSSLAYIPDNDGLFPVHVAAIAGKADVIRELMEICPNCDELYDKKRRNILHCAVEYKRVKVVWHTFRNPNFSRMMNARDIEGNTPLHLAVKYGHLMIFALLVWDSRVNLSIMNNEGLTPLDVAFSNRHSDHTFHFTSTSIITWLTLCEASGGPCHQARNLTDKGCLEDKELRNYTVVFNIITLISLLMATGSFAAPFIAPLGYIAELEDAFMPVFRGRSGFWIFIIANTMSLVLSTVATCVHANKTTISMRCRLFYLTSAAGLVFGAAMFMLITFTNRWEEYILFWLVSNFAVPLCSWVATSNRPWQNISKVIAAAVLVAMVRSFIITGQLLFKGYCLVNMKPAVGLGARYKVMQTLYTPVEIWPL